MVEHPVIGPTVFTWRSSKKYTIAELRLIHGGRSLQVWRHGKILSHCWLVDQKTDQQWIIWAHEMIRALGFWQCFNFDQD